MELFEEPWRRSCKEEGALDARCFVSFVTVDAPDFIVQTVVGLALSDVLAVEGGEVVS